MQKFVNISLLSLILVNFLYIMYGAYLYPLASIDAISIWYLKAKVLYLSSGTYPIEMLKNEFYSYAHSQYPLLIPYFYFAIYVLIGGIRENIIAFFNPFAFILILSVMYLTLRRLSLNATLSLSLIFIYSMFSTLVGQAGRKHAGEVDIFLTLINWVALYFALLYYEKRHIKYAMLIVILVMISSQVKGEGLFLVFLLLFLPLEIKRKVVMLATAFVPFTIWRIFVSLFSIPNDFYFAVPSITEVIERSTVILALTLNEMTRLNNWFIFWPVFMAFILYSRTRLEFINRLVLPTLIFMYCSFFVFYIFLHIQPETYVPGSIDRILIQLSPFYYLIFSILVKNKISPKS